MNLCSTCEMVSRTLRIITTMICKESIESGRDAPPCLVSILLEKCTRDGKRSFSIPLRSLGLNNPLLKERWSDVYNSFFADMIGQWLVNAHLGFFRHLELELGVNSTAKCVHGTFGMTRAGGRMVFTFHNTYLGKVSDQIRKSPRRKALTPNNSPLIP